MRVEWRPECCTPCIIRLQHAVILSPLEYAALYKKFFSESSFLLWRRMPLLCELASSRHSEHRWRLGPAILFNQHRLSGCHLRLIKSLTPGSLQACWAHLYTRKHCASWLQPLTDSPPSSTRWWRRECHRQWVMVLPGGSNQETDGDVIWDVMTFTNCENHHHLSKDFSFCKSLFCSKETKLKQYLKLSRVSSPPSFLNIVLPRRSIFKQVLRNSSLSFWRSSFGHYTGTGLKILLSQFDGFNYVQIRSGEITD